MKKLFKGIGIFLLIAVLLAVGFFGFLALVEYRPGEAGTSTGIDIEGEGNQKIKAGDSIKLMSWNIGYGALGESADFFMDGGKSVHAPNREYVDSNLAAMLDEIKGDDPDIIFIQEIDIDSKRSRHVNELEMFRSELPAYSTAFANNFKVAFLPYPIPPMGKVDSGISIFSKYPLESANRIQLPIPFKWPMSMVNLKRCIIESRIPVEGSDKELVIMNVHLEAYDSGEGKIAQTKALSELMKVEQDKGNYVIVGGDFNQTFSSADASAFPPIEGLWHPGLIEEDSFEGDWQFLMDESGPSCRSLDRPYTGADRDNFQYYLIDGFIASSNIEIKSMHSVQMDFKYSDHNPLLTEFVLK